jgi:hypothetical protein
MRQLTWDGFQYRKVAEARKIDPAWIRICNPCLQPSYNEVSEFGRMISGHRYKIRTEKQQPSSKVLNPKFGSPAWIRTTIHGSKGRCPTIRRPGIEEILTIPRQGTTSGNQLWELVYLFQGVSRNAQADVSVAVVIVAHSLGCLSVACWAARQRGASIRVLGAMLVSPPNLASSPCLLPALVSGTERPLPTSAAI